MDLDPSQTTLPPSSSQSLTTSSFGTHRPEHILPLQVSQDLMSYLAYPGMHLAFIPSIAFRHASLGLPRLGNQNLGAPHDSTRPCKLGIRSWHFLCTYSPWMSCCHNSPSLHSDHTTRSHPLSGTSSSPQQGLRDLRRHSQP